MNSLGIVLPSKWGTISESNIKYEITNTFVAKNAFVGINSVMLEIDRVGIPHWGILSLNITFAYRLFLMSHKKEGDSTLAGCWPHHFLIQHPILHCTEEQLVSLFLLSHFPCLLQTCSQP